MNEYLECGKICNTHGVKGLVKVESWCDHPSVLAGFPAVYLPLREGGYREMKIRQASLHGEWVLVQFEGMETLDAVLPLKGKVLYAKREDIPLEEGALLLADMIGLPVVDVDTGKQYGVLEEVIFSSASDLYAVRTERGRVLLPAVPAFIKDTSKERGILIRPIAGFFDED
ncbi:MAG: ribosome maturation factor RimM [Eubacteriales bacterium]